MGEKVKMCTRCGRHPGVIKLEAFDEKGKKYGDTTWLCSVCHYEFCLNIVNKGLESGAAQFTVVDKDDL